ncbi:unnamed protein product [Prorocentrum cordatum]|uniref:Uncharacterized protein n=1 Tax=Prorocentrum cordatum TaxID=2364126 RepID=A0ABN9R9F6_9DINO|nr:unnamed protein product [Polarella glacialis]
MHKLLERVGARVFGFSAREAYLLLAAAARLPGRPPPRLAALAGRCLEQLLEDGEDLTDEQLGHALVLAAHFEGAPGCRAAAAALREEQARLLRVRLATGARAPSSKALSLAAAGLARGRRPGAGRELLEALAEEEWARRRECGDGAEGVLADEDEAGVGEDSLLDFIADVQQGAVLAVLVLLGASAVWGPARVTSASSGQRPTAGTPPDFRGARASADPDPADPGERRVWELSHTENQRAFMMAIGYSRFMAQGSWESPASAEVGVQFLPRSIPMHDDAGRPVLLLNPRFEGSVLKSGGLYVDQGHEVTVDRYMEDGRMVEHARYPAKGVEMRRIFQKVDARARGSDTCTA